MKTLLVDDERLPRLELRGMLQAFPEIEVVGEAADADEARAEIRRLKPDLLFLDIQMPEETGLELLASLVHAPRVIFVTAHDEHALRAFDFGAIDYLLKPVQEERLARAVQRVLAAAKAPIPEDADPAPASDDAVVPLAADQRVLIRDGDRSQLIPVASIVAAEACGAYAKLFLPDGAPLVHRSLAFLERRLPPGLFFRANRNTLINLRAIKTVEPWFSGGLKATLTNGQAVEISRRQARAFRDTLTL